MFIELAVVAGSVLLMFLLSARLQLFEAFTSWISRHEDLNVDELVPPGLTLMLGLAVFGWRRYRDAHRETARLQQTRAALHETSERYRSLFTHNPHGVYSLDLQGRFESVNQTAQGLAGYTEADLLGKSFTDVMAPDFVESGHALFASAASGTPQQMHTAIRRPDGQQVDLAVKTSPIVVNNHVVGVYGVAENITARKRLERDLQRTQEAVAAASDSVMIGDESNRVVYANDAAARAHGYGSVDDLLGQPVLHLLGQDEHHTMLLDVIPTLREGGRWAGQLTGRRRDDTTFVLEASLSRLPDGCVVAISRDVTDRVAADAALRESEERYRTVLADIAGGYFETDPHGNFTFLNGAAASIAAGAIDDVIGTNVHRYAAPDSADRVRRHAGEVRRTGRTDPGFEWQVVRLDGSRRIVSTSLAVVRSANGEVAGFRGLIRDVTDREATQRALGLSEERHRLLSRVTREVIWDADLTAPRTTWSGAVKDVLGFPEDEIEVGPGGWEARIHPDDVDAVVSSVNAALASTDDTWSSEYRLRGYADRFITVLARGRILRDAEGGAIRFLGSMLDITQYRRQQKDLREARRVAEEANEAKSLFLANMSHELRTPLTTVIAGVEMLLDSPMPPPQKRLLERVSRSGERLLKLVDDLLDFSAIESGDIRMDRIAFDPATVLDQAATWARDACTEQHLDFELSAPTLPQPLLGDPDRLNQVLLNLLGNAVKFTSAGSVRLSVGVIRDEPDAVRLRFTVHDTGPGIDPEHHADIFRSFKQADPSITRRYGGNGLGLAICKEIVEFMGGTIGVDSEPGHGSRFFCEVPFCRSAPQDSDTADVLA